MMARMALAAWLGGAVGIRTNGADDIRAIRRTVPLPIIGIYKDGDDGVYITPTLRHAQLVAEAGADIVALDATQRRRPDGSLLRDIIAMIHNQLGKLVLADISTLEEAVAAESAGADFVASTLSGYTPYSPKIEGPDFELIETMVARLHVPVFAEGRVVTPGDARRAIDCGATSVIVGGAITRPQQITARFVEQLRRSS
jgi:N-acylglucosamine-6-phosphate 2-epimerase